MPVARAVARDVGNVCCWGGALPMCSQPQSRCASGGGLTAGNSMQAIHPTRGAHTKFAGNAGRSLSCSNTCTGVVHGTHTEG